MNEMMKQKWMVGEGLRETTSHPCPRRLVGKVCRRYHQGAMCECEQFGLGQGLLDHPYGFYLPENPRELACIVTHPYNVISRVPASKDDLAMLNGLCETLGLGYEIFSPEDSWYYPGQTHMIVIRKLRQSNGMRLVYNHKTKEISWEPPQQPGFYRLSGNDEYLQ